LGWPPKVGDFRFATKAYHPKKCSAHLFPGRQGLTECHESLTPLICSAGTRQLDLFFENGDTAAVDAEDIEEIIPETLCLGALGGFVFPLLGEGNGAGFYFVPGKRHFLTLKWGYRAEHHIMEQTTIILFVWAGLRIRKQA